MMKLKKYASLLLASAMIALPSCSDGTAPDESNSVPAESQDIPAADITFAANGMKSYIVRPEYASGEGEVDGAQLIVQKITDNLDTRPGFEDDFVRKDVNPDTVRDTEILVGLTNRTA